MIRRYLYIVFAIGALAAADDPGGWTRAKWGMTEDQVITAFGGEVTRFAKPDSANGARIGIERLDLSGTTFKVYMSMDAGGKLERVLLSPIDPKAATDGLFQSLQELLVEKYGRPWVTKEGRITDVQWTVGSTVIQLTRADLALINMRIVSVQYRRRSPDADKM